MTKGVPMVSGSMTCRATSGNGAQTGSIMGITGSHRRLIRLVDLRLRLEWPGEAAGATARGSRSACRRKILPEFRGNGLGLRVARAAATR